VRPQEVRIPLFFQSVRHRQLRVKVAEPWPTASSSEPNQQTGHRIKYLKVDADTGEEVPDEDIVKGYQLEKDQFIEVTKEELEEIALESTRTIEIDEFVDRADIDPRYLIRPYYIRPTARSGTTPSP
jgi:DNA end-binding protein Ku